MVDVDRETLIYPNVLAATKPGDPESPGTFAEAVTNNHDTVVRVFVYWYTPEDGEPVLMIEVDDEDTPGGRDNMDIKLRVRRNDGLVYEGTRATQENKEET